MERIICDTYIKGEKTLLGNDPNSEFNLRIKAVNNMYCHLYVTGILQKTAFMFQDLPDAVCFALDTKDLEPYREAMGTSGLEGAALAVHHIFDEAYTPCMYSGAIELGWFMSTYRNVDGCVGRSWECSLIQGLNTSAIYDVQEVKQKLGTKAAVSKLFSLYNWPVRAQEPLKQQIQSAEGKKGAPSLSTLSEKDMPDRSL